jgi:hypothetical protein
MCGKICIRKYVKTGPRYEWDTSGRYRRIKQDFSEDNPP